MNYLKSFLPSSNAPQHKLLIQGTMDKNNDHGGSGHDEESTLDSPGFTQLTFYDDQCDSPLDPKTKTSYNFVEYKVEKHDTLYSLALKYHNNPDTLREDNKLESDTLEAGQKIRIRIKKKSESARIKQHIKNKDEVLAPLPYEYAMKIREYVPRTLKQLRTKAERIPNDHWKVYFCTNFGDVLGTLTVDSDAIRFKPDRVLPTAVKNEESFEDTEDSEKRTKLLEVTIEIQDIAESNMMAVPSLSCEEHFNANHEFEKDYVIQVMLYNHGTKSMGKYLDNLFQQMKDKKTQYTCVYFKLNNITESLQEYSNDQKHDMLQEIQARIMAAKHAKQNEPAQGLTKLPYFEFLSDRFEKHDAELLRKVSNSSFWGDPEFMQALGNVRKASTNSVEEEKLEGIITRGRSPSKSNKITPRLLDASSILTLWQFSELLNSVPELYQTFEWKLLYSNSVHGTSFSNLLRRAEDQVPFLLVIQDEHKFVFGVYGSDKLRYSEDFYGTGETFLFSFRDLEEISVFKWSKNNNLFISTSNQGLAFGAKPHHGLWIDNELTHGRSFHCETYNNPRLSWTEDFQIMKIELWTIKDPTL